MEDSRILDTILKEKNWGGRQRPNVTALYAHLTVHTLIAAKVIDF
jgi:hypothetical protein